MERFKKIEVIRFIVNEKNNIEICYDGGIRIDITYNDGKESLYLHLSSEDANDIARTIINQISKYELPL